jgi:hypothetical protein
MQVSPDLLPRTCAQVSPHLAHPLTPQLLSVLELFKRSAPSHSGSGHPVSSTGAMREVLELFLPLSAQRAGSYSFAYSL